MVLKTHLEPLREPLKVPPVGQPKNLFFLQECISNEVSLPIALFLFNDEEKGGEKSTPLAEMN